MEIIREMLKDVSLPDLFEVRQTFEDNAVSDPAAAVARELSAFFPDALSLQGKTIAIGVGSRGIASLSVVVRSTVSWFQEQGAKPFLVPCMGSHGKATAEGQTEILRNLGVTEKTAGCSIRSSMDVIEIGSIGPGMPVYTDKNAFEADGIFVINRVKPHTAFSGPNESGLAKMLVIGLGKQKGAEACHRLGYKYFAEIMPKMARTVLEKAPVIGGLALVENSLDHLAHIEFVHPENLVEKDAELLLMAKRLMPRLPVRQLDALLVYRMGKDISGSGLDPNITGRAASPWKESFLDVTKLAVLRLTHASHGNATGIGASDIISRTLLNDLDLETTYANTMTTSMLKSACIPVVMPDDETAVRCLIKTCNAGTRSPRLIFLRDTLSLNRFFASPDVAEELKGNPTCSVATHPCAFAFHADGTLVAPRWET